MINFLLSDTSGYFEFPKSIYAWGAWLGFLLIIVWLAWNYRRFHPKWQTAHWWIFAILAFINLITSLFFGISLVINDPLPIPGTPETLADPVWMIFAGIPWFLSSGLLGVIPTTILAALSGGLIAFYVDHSIFLPLLYAFLGLWLAYFVRQRYRTRIYSVLRNPFFSGILLIFAYPFLYIIFSSIFIGGDLPERLEFATNRVAASTLAFAGQVMLGAIIAQITAKASGELWFANEKLEPSPGEISQETRLRLVMIPLAILLSMMLFIGDWMIAGRAAQDQLISQMQASADTVSESLPFALETGQNNILRLAEDSRWEESLTASEIYEILVDGVRDVPYFHQITFLDMAGFSVTGYPVVNIPGLLQTESEMIAIELARQGVQYQYYSIPPEPGDTAARLAFFTLVEDSSGTQLGILWGRTNLSENPYFNGIFSGLSSMTDVSGEGMVLDEDGLILFHPNSELVGSNYDLDFDEPFLDLNGVGRDGSRQMVYGTTVSGREWLVVTTVPTRIAQYIALKNALSLVSVLLFLVLLAFGTLQLGLQKVLNDLMAIAKRSRKIADGDWDVPLEVDSVDEIGQLARSLEHMRQKLKDRMEDLRRLLLISEGVVSGLELKTTIQPILEGALIPGASSARVVLSTEALPEMKMDYPTQFGLGKSTEKFTKIDSQILAHTKERSEVLIANPARARLYPGPDGKMPESILAVALKNDGKHYGALWVAFDENHQFSDGERRFIKAVAGFAAQAAAKSRLYSSAHVGRQRMEAILSSSADPVLVTDFQNRLLLINPVGQDLLGDNISSKIGQSIENVIEQKLLLDLLLSREDQPMHVEVDFGGNRVYFARVSSVMFGDQFLGRVCVLSDISHFKELDAIKTDFVSTVSHDLRLPLSLIKGYAEMLTDVGPLTDQQINYRGRILTGVHRMNDTVNNLLDLGRMEAGVGLEVETISLIDLLRQTADSLRFRADQKDIEFKIHVPSGEIASIEGDLELLKRVFYNLVDNALKYTEVKGEVVVSVKELAEEVLVEVADNGFGISPVDLPGIFKAFNPSVQRRARKERGPGLGLAIVKSVVERHRGTVEVKSQLGKGSVFSVHLPRKQPR